MTEIHIRRNSDGVVRVVYHDAPFSEYLWYDGNFSCDCNRHLFFQRAAEEPDGDDVPCGDDVAYSIVKVVE